VCETSYESSAKFCHIAVVVLNYWWCRIFYAVLEWLSQTNTFIHVRAHTQLHIFIMWLWKHSTFYDC